MTLFLTDAQKFNNSPCNWTYGQSINITFALVICSVKENLFMNPHHSVSLTLYSFTSSSKCKRDLLVSMPIKAVAWCVKI